MDFSLMVAASLAILASVAITASFETLRRLGQEAHLPIISSGFFWRWGVLILFPWALSALTFLALYRYLPNTQVEWPYLAFGALLGSAGFEVTKHVFVWYVQSYSTYALVYGSLGTLVAFLTWAYLSAVMLLVGGEVASVMPKVVGRRALPLPEERALRALQELFRTGRAKRASRAKQAAAPEEAGLAEGGLLVALAPPQAPPTVRKIIGNLFREWVAEAAERSPRNT